MSAVQPKDEDDSAKPSGAKEERSLDPIDQVDSLLRIRADLSTTRRQTRRYGIPIIGALSRGLRQLGYASLFYGLRLKGQFPSRLLASPSDLWPGDAATGQLIADGIFRYGDAETSGDVPDFTDPDLPRSLKAWLHSFAWLRDLAALGDVRRARAIAEPALKEWLEHYSRWDRIAWAPEVTGQRLMSIINHAPLVLASQDLVYRSKALNAMAQQGRHLARVLDMAAPGEPRIIAATGLAFSSLLLPGGERRVKVGLKALEDELNAVLLSDGMVESRNPEDLMGVLRALITLRDGYRAARKTPPTFLQVAIDKASAALKGVVVTGAGVAAFNGARNGLTREADSLIDLAESGAAPMLNGRASGYQRVEAGRAVAILDAGLPPKGPLSKSAHAGLLAFTLFDEGQPLFVNCGGDTDAAQDLPQGALRATAAHSAIALQDTNAAQIRTNGQIGRAGQETCFGRDARGGGEAVVATSDCYARRYGMTISRGLWLRGDGNLILGRDVIRSIAAPKASLSADIRFHVHPDVTVSLTGGGAILRLPNGNWWNLRTDGVEVILEPSVYVAAHDARPRQTQQVVFSLPLEAEENSVRWSLTRG